MRLTYNDRAKLHQSLDNLIDSAEKRGLKMTLLEGEPRRLRILNPRRKGQEAAMIWELQVGVLATTFRPELQNTIKHLLPMVTPWVLLALPAESISDFEKWKAERSPGIAKVGEDGKG